MAKVYIQRVHIPEITTDRLRLRALTLDDFEAYAAMHADPEVTRFTVGAPLSRVEAWRHMSAFAGQWLLRGYGMFAVEERATGTFVGRVGFHHPIYWPGPELAWTIGRNWWGRGYATEAARRLLDHGFRDLGFPRIISLIHHENVASIAVAERIGERLEGEIMLETSPNPVLQYAIGRDTFR